MSTLALYLLAGCTAGFFGGLMGIGGGLILVPALTILFAAQQIAEPLVMPLALGTSLASIVFTSLASVRAHHARGAVDWPLVRRMVPGLATGAVLGAVLSTRFSPEVLKLFFLAFAAAAATQMLVGCRPQATRALPGPAALFAAGGAISCIASLAGVGGASMTIPLMAQCSVPLRSAIGSASAMGLPIALAGVAGYAVNGLHMGNLPPWCLGFIHLPALSAVAAGSVIAAPLGAALSHKLPVSALKGVFALMMYAIAGKMLVAVL